MKLLRLSDKLTMTNADYYQFTKPKLDEYDITICTYFRTELSLDRPRRIEGPSNPFGFLRALRRLLTKEQFDIIHIHSPYLGVFFLLANTFNRRRLSRTVYTVHNSFHSYRLKHLLTMIPCFAAFRRVVFCSESSYASFPKFYKWLAGKRGTVIQNGSNLALLDLALEGLEPPPAAKPFTVAWIGRLIPIKNTITSLKAFKQATDPPDELVVMGDGPLKDELMAEAVALGLESRVHFTGVIPREEVFRQLASADVYLSSSYGEGLPIAVLEAMACRCPAILSDIPPHREVAVGGDCASLVDPDDTPGFVEAIRQFRAMSREERQSRGEQCRQIVEECFSVDIMLGKYDALYIELMKEDS